MKLYNPSPTPIKQNAYHKAVTTRTLEQNSNSQDPQALLAHLLNRSLTEDMNAKTKPRRSSSQIHPIKTQQPKKGKQKASKMIDLGESNGKC